ncbi:MAG: cytochrome c3 family protein [Saprospiraceae bacterium]
MKNVHRILVLLLAAMFCQAAFGQTIVGSEHDFSNKNWNNTGEICVVCHTPHHADLTVADAPLWNHEVTASTFTLYSSATFDGSSSIGQPDGASKLCLSCHDGTVAVENFGGTNNGNNYVGGNKMLGTDLSDDHPISFTYNSALATTDGGLFDPANTNSGLGGTIQDDMLFSDKLQCASCHDVHNGSGLSKLLVINNNASALCLTCHDK